MGKGNETGWGVTVPVRKVYQELAEVELNIDAPWAETPGHLTCQNQDSF